MSAVVAIHVVAGTLALVSGAVAISVRKGERVHRAGGAAFALAMMVMTALGGVMAWGTRTSGTTIIAALTFYLVATAWMTVRRPEGSIGRFEYGALAASLGCAAAFLVFGVANLDAYPMALHLIFGSIAALAALGDWRVVRSGGITGANRIARHLWRMCAALLIAALSFFLGQQDVMPAWLRGHPALYLPELAVIALMIFYLVTVRRSQRRLAVAATAIA